MVRVVERGTSVRSSAMVGVPPVFPGGGALALVAGVDEGGPGLLSPSGRFVDAGADLCPWPIVGPRFYAEVVHQKWSCGCRERTMGQPSAVNSVIGRSAGTAASTVQKVPDTSCESGQISAVRACRSFGIVLG